MNGLKPISVLTFGAGAIGTYVGGSLALAGHRVVFIEQPSIAAELRQHGLRLDVSIDKHREAAEPLIVLQPVLSASPRWGRRCSMGRLRLPSLP